MRTSSAMGVNGLDIALVLVALAAFIGGYRRGLLSRVCTWIGAVVGVVVVGQNVERLLPLLGDPQPERRLPIIVALLVGGFVLGRVVGWFLGDWIQGSLPTWPLRSLNRFAGGVVAVAGVIAIVWLSVPLFGQVPGWPATTTRSSAIARAVDEKLPKPPDSLSQVRRLVVGGRFPQVVSALRRSLDGGEPPSTAALDAPTVARVSASVVKVTAVGCGAIADGTGFVLADGPRPGAVLTNAHVVAGATRIDLIDASGTSVAANVVAFDPQRDLALLEATSNIPGAEGLSFGAVDLGDELAVFGHPGGGPLRVEPSGLAERLVAVGRDIYDARSASRPVLVLAGRLEPGDSGAPVVNRSGDVTGIAFAVAPDRSTTAYALPVEEINAFLAAGGAEVNGTAGRCLIR